MKGPTPVEGRTYAFEAKKLNQPLQNENTPKGWGHLFSEFSENTTLHGMRWITGHSVFVLRRVVWGLLFLACVGVFCFYAYNRMSTYLKYEMSINVQDNYVDSLEFPALTICNTNTFKLSDSVKGGFYEDVKKILEVKKSMKGVKKCIAGEEFECQPGECVRSNRLCDFFPDCSNQADEAPENCDGQCQIVCVDSADSSSGYEPVNSLTGRCFVYDSTLNTLYNLTKQAFFSSALNQNQTGLYLYYDDSTSIWVFAEQVSRGNGSQLLAYRETLQDTITFDERHGWLHEEVVQIEINITLPLPSNATNSTLGGDFMTGNLTNITTSGEFAPCNISNITTSGDIWSCNSTNQTGIEYFLTTKTINVTKIVAVDMFFSCHALNVESPQLTDVLGKLIPSTSQEGIGQALSDLYNTTAPRLLDSLIKCSWKGEPCSMDNFTERFTDMGLCYTFATSEPSTLPGPGYGLSLMFNIEQYEYTRDSEDGVGIRVLLHDARDEPVMDQNSFAISPGLYTLLSVERTEVTTLESPWGNCVTEDLKYYSLYTMATCKMECENKVIRQKCGCRDVHMPDIGAELNRKVGNFCQECPPPCKEVKYVPSISFSTISTKTENLGSTMKDLTVSISSKVAGAREYTYRLFPEKYRESLRMFARITSSLSAIRSLLQGAVEAFATDLDEVRMRVVEVQTDCVWFTSGQNELVQVLQDEILVAGSSYVQHVKSNVVTPLLDLMSLVSVGEEKTVNETYYAWRVAAVSQLFRMNDTLSATLNEILPAMILLINQTSTSLPLVLDKQKIEPLLSYSRAKCPECLDYRDTVLEGLTKDLLKTLVEDVVPGLEMIQRSLSAFEYSEELEFDVLFEWNEETSARQFEHVRTLLQNHVDLVEQKIIKPTRKTLSFALELIRLTASKCGSELQRPLEGYMDSHTRMEIAFDVAIAHITKFGNSFQRNSKAYEDVEMTLAKLTDETTLGELAENLATSLVTLQGLLDQRKISLSRIGQYINVINYWFLAQTSSSTLQANSKYWESLSLTNPATTNPPRENPNIVAKSEEYVITDSTVDSYWAQLKANLDKNRKSAEDAVYNFNTDVLPAKVYVEEYQKGNVLEETFLGSNVLQLDVFYKELKEKTVNQLKAYEYQSLLGEVGGLMGLLLGASMMTIFEFLDFFVSTCAKKCSRKKSVAPTLRG